MEDKIVEFPFGRTVGSLPNDGKMEWLYICLDGKPDATKKRLILLARNPEVGFLDDQQAQTLIDALGLREA